MILLISIDNANTDELYYRPATNEFGVIDKNRVIRTYMSPRNGYWDEQLIKFVK